MSASPILRVILFFILCSNSSYAQVFPQENSVLNYRIIGFSFPAVPKATDYKIEVMPGNVTTTAAFKVELSSTPSDKNRIICEVPSFGSQYTWRISYNINGKQKTSRLGHFSTGISQSVDTTQSRLQISKNFTDTAQYYLLVDGNGTMYDLNGNPVWYLATQSKMIKSSMDLKKTKFHTLTFMSGRGSEEIDYDCNVLWEAPNNVGNNNANMLSMGYHHEFTRAARNSYFVLCNEIKLQGPAKVQKDNRYVYFPNANENPVSECILFDFNTCGNTLWSWNSSDYLKKSDLGYLPNTVFQGHENSFYFDSAEQSIYLSYAGMNRIVKINYPSGNIEQVYGNTLSQTQAGSSLLATQNQLEIKKTLDSYVFKGEHNCTKSPTGDLMLYNNNLGDTIPPEVLILNPDHGNLTKKWSYKCPADLDSKQNPPPTNGGGGSVESFSDSLLLVQMNNPLNKTFIVNNKKELLWSGILENKRGDNTWQSASSYRACIVTRAELEELIWNSQRSNKMAGTQ